MVKKQPIWVPKKKIRHTKYLKRKNQVAKVTEVVAEVVEEVVAEEVTEVVAEEVTEEVTEVVAEDKLFFYSFYYHCFIF